ncbi:arsenate reductase (glutaredoxin) [Vannielia sp.]|uniref:arsenate reductase (glutaredoxin) n=1 Tax=Vannielia sp. TaxID=2813045 RepID=UPI00262A7D65|nr:arsenate reductase (glutaredoxin) [Vannielia sp.]MDF1873898.1 arsenate reductase (glutaredoxin) [Vannielia sp.]
MSDVVIWHNPRCSKSRETLKLLTDKGYDPVVRLYLDSPPSPEELQQAVAELGVRPIEMMRTKEAAFGETKLTKDSPDDMLIAAMAATPKLIERPIVFAHGKAAIGRPPERVLDILK